MNNYFQEHLSNVSHMIHTLTTYKTHLENNDIISNNILQKEIEDIIKTNENFKEVLPLITWYFLLKEQYNSNDNIVQTTSV